MASFFNLMFMTPTYRNAFGIFPLSIRSLMVFYFMKTLFNSHVEWFLPHCLCGRLCQTSDYALWKVSNYKGLHYIGQTLPPDDFHSFAFWNNRRGNGLIYHSLSDFCGSPWKFLSALHPWSLPNVLCPTSGERSSWKSFKDLLSTERWDCTPPHAYAPPAVC